MRFKDFILDIEEPEYRSLDAYNYSRLARFYRVGYDEDALARDERTESLTLGSIVDTLVLEPHLFGERFIVSTGRPMPDTVRNTVRALFDRYGDKHDSLSGIPSKALCDCAKANLFYKSPSVKDETRYSKFFEHDVENYYASLYTGKTMVTEEMYSRALACESSLKASGVGQVYLMDTDYDREFGFPRERLFQVKLCDEIQGVRFKAMYDMIIVDHFQKTVTPCDLKTTSNPVDEFPKSFLKYNYDIQARLYSKLLREVMDKSEDLNDYKINPFTFIVVNTGNFEAMDWTFDCMQDDMMFHHTYQIGSMGCSLFPSPYTLAVMLDRFMSGGETDKTDKEDRSINGWIMRNRL